MTRRGTVPVALIAVVAVVSAFAAPSWATPILDLSMSGPATMPSPGNATITIIATNVDFGLAGLVYTVQASVVVDVSARQYSSYGWFANDGSLDNCSPAEEAVGTGLTSFYFDTLLSPVLSERPAGTTATVEHFDIAIPAGLADGTVIDLWLSDVSASDGGANDLEGSLGGQVTTSGLQIIVPEPRAWAMALLLGGLFLRRSR